MSFRVVYEPGQKIGECIFLRSEGGRKSVFKCRCGKEFITRMSRVTAGVTTSCGCVSLSIHTKHGHARQGAETHIYHAWQSMKCRCLNKQSKFFHNYGGRGIKMHATWVNDFAAFLEYMKSIGADKMEFRESVDRINNNGNYEPGNIRVANYRMQANNRRSNVRRWFAGVEMTLADIARASGISGQVLDCRLNRGGETLMEATSRLIRTKNDPMGMEKNRGFK